MTSRASRAKPLPTRVFLGSLPDLVREALPPDLQDFQVRGPMFSLIGFYYEDPKVHYEVWLQPRLRRVELGLHFEGPAAANLRGLERVSEHAAGIVEALGPGVEGELWDKGWTRVHEGLPLEERTPAFAARLAARIGAFIAVLEPVRRSGRRP